MNGYVEVIRNSWTPDNEKEEGFVISVSEIDKLCEYGERWWVPGLTIGV